MREAPYDWIRATRLDPEDLKSKRSCSGGSKVEGLEYAERWRTPRPEASTSSAGTGTVVQETRLASAWNLDLARRLDRFQPIESSRPPTKSSSFGSFRTRSTPVEHLDTSRYP